MRFNCFFLLLHILRFVASGFVIMKQIQPHPGVTICNLVWVLELLACQMKKLSVHFNKAILLLKKWMPLTESHRIAQSLLHAKSTVSDDFSTKSARYYYYRAHTHGKPRLADFVRSGLRPNIALFLKWYQTLFKRSSIPST